MENETATAGEDAREVVRTLTKPQRRVLGVLLEKAFTTPDQYPLTCKSATSGSNQKSNRDPVTNYSEDAVLDALDELRELGLVLQLHTESGRTERYRHLTRKHYTFTEPQLAILTELLLRGQQTLGELRSRASRMVPIESLDVLRSELTGLINEGFARASGPLERRGVEVDHAMHAPNESPTALAATAPESVAPAQAAPSQPVVAAPTPIAAPAPTAAPVPAVAGPVLKQLEESIGRIEAENRDLREQVEKLLDQIRQLDTRFDDLRRDLGG